MSKIDEKRLWIIEARDGAWGANGICKGELVRCGECEHWEAFKNGVNGWCNRHGVPQGSFWFCADGERRTE